MRTISNLRPVSARHITLRTCVACRQVKDKRELVRLVRTPAGNVEIDDTGKKAGRGAYICKSPLCWETALKGDKLEHTLRTDISREQREQLGQEGKNLLKGVTFGNGQATR